MKRGFTLIEMLIVVVVIGVLIAMAVPRFVGVANEARTRQCAGNIRAMDSAIELYNSRNNGYPADIDTVLNDTDYFPDGPPECPYAAGYAGETDTDGNVIGCARASHFAIGSWPHEHD